MKVYIWRPLIDDEIDDLVIEVDVFANYDEQETTQTIDVPDESYTYLGEWLKARDITYSTNPRMFIK